MVDDSAVDLLDGESRPVSSPDSTEIQSNPVVAVVRTSPETVLNDIKVAMNLGGYTSVLQHDLATLLKINISWPVSYTHLTLPTICSV